MLQRTLMSTTITIVQTEQTFMVQTTAKVLESTIGSGKAVEEVTRYERLTEGETRDLLEVLVYADLPGATTTPHPSLF